MSRTTLLAVLSLAALAMLGTFSSSSFALSAGAGASSDAVQASKAFKMRVHYEAEYTDAIFGPLRCAGNHIASKKHPGTETSGGADKFKCTSTTEAPITGITAGQPVVFGSWASDYFYFVAKLPEYVLAKEVSGKASKDGKSFKALAIF